MYYPIYDMDDWNQSPLEKPILGQYGTDSPVVAATQISWAKRNQIDGFLVSWEGIRSHTDDHLRRGLLSAWNVASMKVIVIYEATSLPADESTNIFGIDFNSSAVRSKFLQDMDGLTKYFWHPSYQFLANRPVVVLRSSRLYSHFTLEFLSRVKRDIGVNVYFVGDEIVPDMDLKVADSARGEVPRTCRGCDAFTALDMYRESAVVAGESCLSYHKRVVFPSFSRWSTSNPVFPLLTPKYNVYGVEALPGNSTDFWLQMKLARELQFVRTSELVRTIFFVRSFNHWYEGSSIEPSKEFGFDFLNALNASVF